MAQVKRGLGKDLVVAVIVVLGLSLTAALAWSLEHWIAEREMGAWVRAGEAWGHRLGQEIRSDENQLTTIAVFFGQVPEVDPGLFSSLVHSLSMSSSVTSMAWSPEVTSTDLSSFLSKYPHYGFTEADLRTRLGTSAEIFPIVMAWGSSTYLVQGRELGDDPAFAQRLEQSIESRLVTSFLSSNSVDDPKLHLLCPVVAQGGEPEGVLTAELDLAKLVSKARGDLSEPLSLRLLREPSGGDPKELLWGDSRTIGDQTFVVSIPLIAGGDRWSAEVYSSAKLSTVSWEAALALTLGLAFTLLTVLGFRSVVAEAIVHEGKAVASAQNLKAKEQAYLESVQRLARAEERYRDLFEKSQAMIWIQDREGVLLDLNPASADSLGYQMPEMKGRNLKDFIIPTERHTFGQYLERASGQETSKGLLKLYTKNGATRFWMYQTSLSEDSGEISVRCHALDVTESQQAERELERLSRRNELILESVGEGVYGINLAGECSFVNPAALKFTGYSAEELMKAAHTMHEILQPHKGDGQPYPWEDSAVFTTLSDGEVRRVKAEWMWRRDGSRFPVDYVVSPIVEDDERILGAVVTFQDVTERRAIEQMKNEFISIVSHELRTPLTSIRGSLGLLASGLLKKFPDKAEKMLKIAVENTDRLVRLINDILDIERLESGKVTIEQRECELSSLMLGAAETMQAMAQDNGVRLIVEPFQTTVWADSDRCLQVFTNLLSNAIKFSENDGEVKLLAELYGDDGGHWVKVSVKDSGRGVPPEALEKIFERFGQVDASDSREKGGTGLGLPICKTIVEQHGGKMWVESKSGEGSTFFFTLPTEPRDLGSSSIEPTES